MPYVTRFEQLVLEQGRAEGAANLIVRQARKRFSGLGSEDEAAIGRLPLGRLEDLSEALLDFTDIGDLRRWLSLTSPPK